MYTTEDRIIHAERLEYRALNCSNKNIENISLTLRETLSHSLDRLAEAEITKIKLFQVSARQSVFQDRISQILRNVELSWKILRIFLMICETGV